MAALEAAILKFGRIDVLIDNAGNFYAGFRFIGDAALRARVHRHFGAALAHDCFAGSAQNTEFLRDAGLPGSSPQYFFAPMQIRERNPAG